MTTPFPVTPEDARDSFDTGPLSWVIVEIREALNRSKASLAEALTQDAETQSTTLRHAKSFLHQAHGALQIVDVDGISLITETVEDLFDRAENGQITITQEVADAISNAYQALLEYLEELLSGVSHQPVRLFPYYRTLLEVRGAERIHPADLFFPNLANRPQLPPAPPLDKPVDYVAVRKRFERSLLPFLKSTDRAAELANAGAMRDLVAEVERAQGNQQSRVFWWVLHGFAEAVAAGLVKNELYVKQLFARINLQIRRLSEGSSSIAERLLRDALFFIAKAENPTPRVQQIRRAYQLDGSVPADYEKKRYGQVDTEALAFAKERLSHAKNAWNRIAGGDGSVANVFESELAALAEAGVKLNSPPLLKLLRELGGISRQAVHARAGEMLGLEMATALLFVENALNHIGHLPDNFAERADAMTSRLLSVVSGDHPTINAEWMNEMSREAQQRQTMQVLTGELQTSLRQVEKQLDEYFNDPKQREALAQIETTLHQIGGALAILDQDDALAAVQHTQKAVHAFVESAPETVPDVTQFQHVARNVGALSFFIESLQLNSEGAKKRFSFDRETGVFHANLLEKNTVARIDVEVVEESVSASAHDKSDSIEPVVVPEPVAVTDLPTVEDELVLHQQHSVELANALTAEPDNVELKEQLKESLEQVRRDATLVDNPEATDRAQAAIKALSHLDTESTQEVLAEIITASAPVVVEQEPAPLPVAVPAPETDEEVDAELLEIFLSEAEEVLGCVKETIPQSRSEPYNQDHLTTLRRSFHTLKGSGRMVGLMAFGEGAWSIEQVLNLRLSETRAGDADLYALLDKATEILSAWVDDLLKTGKSSRTPHALVRAAEHIKAGEPFQYEEAAAVAPVAAPVPTAAPETAHAFTPEAVVPPPVAFAVEPEAAYAPIEPERIDIPPVVEPVVEPVLEAPHALETKHDEGAAVLEEVALSPEVLAQLHAAESGHVEHVEAVAHTEHIELPDLDLDIPEELTAAPALPVAEVLDFPGMTKPVAQDDSVKRIGDLEISLPLHNIYLAETDELVRRLSQDIAEWRHEPERHVNVLAVHAAHSLSGSSATVGFTPLQEIAHALEMVLQFLARKPVRLIDSEYDTLEHGIERIRFMLQMFALGEMPDHEPEQVQILERMQSEIEARLHMTPELAPLPHGFAEHRHEVVAEPVAPVEPIETIEIAPVDEHIEPAIEHIEVAEPVHHVEPVAEVPHVVEHIETPALIEPIELHAAPTAEAIDAVAADLGIPEIPALEAHDFSLPETHELPEVPAIDGTLADQVAHLENLLGQSTPEVVELAALPVVEEIPALEPVAEEVAAPVTFEHVPEVSTPEPVIETLHVEQEPVAELPAIEEIHEPVIHEALVQEHEPLAHQEPAIEIPAIEEPVLEQVEPEPVAETHVESHPAVEEHVPVMLEGEPLAVAHIPHTPFAEPVFPQNEEAVVDPAVMLLLKDELDPDLLPVFLEEGRDMFPQLAEELRNWQKNPADIGPQNASLRLLHTIKGSARMAGAMNLGQHMHELETRIEQLTRSGSPSAAALDEIVGRYDQGQQMFDDLVNPQAKIDREAAAAAAEAAAAAAANAPVSAQPVEATATPVAREMVELKSLIPSAPSTNVATPRAATPVAKAATPTAPVSLVRVRADILDRLVNQAGEVSISRSKLETEVGTLRQSLSEMTENVSRLRDQLREIEMQAESQISSRMGQSADREFDPLEFDRFTRLQELTRMMAESVNDVGTVQQNLSRTIDNANNDLITQGRLTRDLQQDLMRVRMVQFASISERLYRVTRQASKELDKRVNLDIRGSAVEMDRGVLERMTGPFEHLLRNAIVHGIETRERRVAAGKAEIGEMLVEIRQEGNEVVIQFSDDGQGLNLERIRSKALSVGLISASDELSENEVTDLIFNPGFSTAEQVTELAGRGVGMDVVRSEAAALGGRVSVVSELGKGAHFTVHLPLTLAVTQVVILTTGGKTYAVPSVLVEQVQQLKTSQLTNAYNDGAVMWQGQRVPLHYLAALLGDHDAAPIAQQYSPIIILKSGNDRLAIHVDEIQGNREVVVKNIGPQLARMIGIAGATVLGSGEIVLILNPVPLSLRYAHENIRAPRLTPAADVPENMGAVATLVPAAPAAPVQAEPVQGLRTQHIVMVVDDSLTVRRVTQRLLAREGYQVVLAKDGVDALEHLQSINPDVMLVDIEMPRMDGFDLTRNVRNDERTRHIPIIMITSRTASKHRNYAMELGVNEYLGKPYQEDALLKSIAGFVNKEAPVA